MTALLFALGIVALSLVLIVFTVHHMVDTVMKLHDDLLDERLSNYGINLIDERLDKYGINKASKKYKEDDNDSDRT